MLALYLCKEEPKKIRKFDPFADKIQLDTDSLAEIESSKTSQEKVMLEEEEIIKSF